jgi:hypothetical protein
LKPKVVLVLLVLPLLFSLQSRWLRILLLLLTRTRGLSTVEALVSLQRCVRSVLLRCSAIRCLLWWCIAGMLQSCVDPAIKRHLSLLLFCYKDKPAKKRAKIRVIQKMPNADKEGSGSNYFTSSTADLTCPSEWHSDEVCTTY